MASNEISLTHHKFLQDKNNYVGVLIDKGMVAHL